MCITFDPEVDLKPCDVKAAADIKLPKQHNVRAKVLCSYDAIDATELDLTANEV